MIDKIGLRRFRNVEIALLPVIISLFESVKEIPHPAPFDRRLGHGHGVHLVHCRNGNRESYVLFDSRL